MKKRLLFLLSLSHVIIASESAQQLQKTPEQATLKAIITVSYSSINEYSVSCLSKISVDENQDLFAKAHSTIAQMTNATFKPKPDNPIIWEYYSPDDIRPNNEQAQNAYLLLTAKNKTNNDQKK